MHKFLFKLTKRQIENIQIDKIRDKGGGITDTKEIQRMYNDIF